MAGKLVSSIVRTTVVTLILAGAVLWAFQSLVSGQQAKALREMQALKEQFETLAEQRKAMVERLSMDRRLAHIVIDDQQLNEAGDVVETTLQFIELNDKGIEIARDEFTVPGDVVFIDALTIKFGEDDVALGNALRDKTLVLLQRVYSEHMRPIDGFPIDTPGAAPPAYAADDMGQFEVQLWKQFWALASSATLAQRMGIRVAQGEAIYKKVTAGESYELIADADGGLNLVPLPPDSHASRTR